MGPSADGDISCLRRWRGVPVRDPFPGTITIRSERAGLQLADDASVHVAMNTCDPEVDCFHSSFEENYTRLRVRELPSDRLAFLPVLVETQGRARRLHRVRSLGLSGTLAARRSGAAGAYGRLRALSPGGTGARHRIQEAQGDEARRVHRPDGGHPDVPVARADGGAECGGADRERSRLPSGAAARARRRVLDPPRQIDRGMDHQPPALQCRFRLGAEHRYLPLLHRLRGGVRDSST